MTSVIVLKSEFIESLKEKRAEFSELLGKDISFYIKRAVSGPKWTLYDDGFIVSNLDKIGDNIIVISSGAVGLTEEILYRFLASDQELLRDYYGKVGGIKLSKEEAHDLIDNFKEDFSNFYEAWSERFERQVGEEGIIQENDEIDLDLPLIESYTDLQLAREQMAFDICLSWIKKGVRIDRPESCQIGPDVKIGPGTCLLGNISIMGKSDIGLNCLIKGESRIVDSKIEDNVTIRSSIIEESIMEEGSNIGPFSHLRPKSRLGKGVHVGNFVELKKASLDQGTKAGHLAYIGDAEVGKDVNISCGVIFCNYDGKNKHKAVVGDGTFLGSNSNLVAPVNIAKEAFIAAGSTICKDVDEGDLALERAEEKRIKGYVNKRKEKGSL